MNMKKYLANSFSLQMLGADCNVKIRNVKAEDIPSDAVSCVGHADTAAVLSSLLGREIPCNRESIDLMEGDELYVAQIVGGRLPEGATTLPEGVKFKFFKVTAEYSWCHLCNCENSCHLAYSDESIGCHSF